MRGALAGIRVIDLSVNAPGPFATLMLADLGAEVTVITNPAGPPDYAGAKDDPMLAARGGPNDALARGKSERPLDLKSEAGRAALLRLAADADLIVSEMRPGKLDRLGLGWEVLQAANPALILCEITGYGDQGPMAAQAGHDLNYLALSGALSLTRGHDGTPLPPQNLIGDYAAGGAFAVIGLLAALRDRDRTGRGQRLCLSMTDGVRYLGADITAATLRAGHDEALWRGTLGGDMPTYACYRTADDQWMAVGALEPKFIAALAGALDWPDLSDLMARKSGWQAARAGLATRFATRSRAAWTAHFAGLDACVTPVLSVAEAGSPPDLPGVFGVTPTG